MNIYFKLLMVLTVSGTVLLNSCAKKGCTDYVSYMYDSDAAEDDGTCAYYYGGKNYGQLDVGAVINSNQQYDIYFDGQYIGRLLHYWSSGLSCAQPDAIGRILTSGFHTVRAVGVVGGDTREGSVYLDPQECQVVLIENLQLITGGGSAGYMCSSGNCSYVSSGASYSTLSACQNSCSGGGSAGYYCSSGNCSYVSSGASYPTLSACQSSCGGGGSAGYDCFGGNCSYVSSGADYASLSDCQNNCGGSTGNLTFWVNQDLGCGNIYVNVTSYGTGTISYYYSSQPDCGDSGCANFSGLGLGAYTYSVTSDGGCTWSGNVQVTNGCNLLQLSM